MISCVPAPGTVLGFLCAARLAWLRETSSGQSSPAMRRRRVQIQPTYKSFLVHLNRTDAPSHGQTLARASRAQPEGLHVVTLQPVQDVICIPPPLPVEKRGKLVPSKPAHADKSSEDAARFRRGIQSSIGRKSAPSLQSTGVRKQHGS